MKTKNCLTKVALMFMCCVFALTFVFVGANSVTASALEGSGKTAADPYQIASEADLVEFAGLTGTGNTGTAYIQLTADIELTANLTLPSRTVYIDLNGNILNLGAYKLTVKRATTIESKATDTDGNVNGIITADKGNAGLVVAMTTNTNRLTIKDTVNLVAINANLINRTSGVVTNNAVDGNKSYNEDKVEFIPLDGETHKVVTILEDDSRQTLIESIACVADDGDCMTARICVCTNELAPAETAHLYEDPCSAVCEREGCEAPRDVIPHVNPGDDGDCATPIICANEECGAEIVPAKEHDFTSPDEETLATVCNAACQNEGCEYNRIPPHDEPADDNNCETPVFCGLCGDTVVPAVAHTWTDDCDDECDVCGTTRDDAPHYDLTPNDDDCTTAEVCSKCEQIAIEAIAHTYDTDCGDADNICNNEGCNHVYDPEDPNETLFIEHTPDEESEGFTDNNCETEVLCTVCGQVAIEALQHTWDGNCDEMCNNEGCTYAIKRAPDSHIPAEDDGDCTTPILCEICNAVVTPAVEHVFDNDCYDEDGICNNDGCEAEFAATADHTPDEESDAFLDNDCETEVLCTVCGQVAIEALVHDFDNACDVDCNNDGCEYVRETVHEYNYSELDFDCTTAHECVHCGELSIPYGEHQFTACDDATCNNPECDYVREAPGHEYTPEADCTKETRCTVCDNIVIPAEADHDFPNDCTSETCTRCEVANPNWVDHTYADDDDCTTAVYCDVCSVEIIPAAEHVYDADDPCDPHCNVCGTSRVVLHKPAYSLDCTVDTLCELCGDVVIAALESHTSDLDCADEDGFCNNPGCNVAFADFAADHIADENELICSEESYCTVCDLLLKGAYEHTYDFDCYDEDGICNIDGCGHELTAGELKTHKPANVDNDCTTETLCGVCGSVTTTAQTHVFDFDCYDEDGICNNHGCLVEFEAVGHIPDDNEFVCSEESYCTVCSMLLKEAGQHTYDFNCYDEDGICNNEGCGHELTEGELTTHIPGTVDNDCTTPTYCKDCGIVTTRPQSHVFDFDCYDADGVCNNHGCLVEFEATAEHTPDANYGICAEDSFCVVCSELLKEAFAHTFDFDCYDADGICNIEGCGYEITDGDLKTHTPEAGDKDCSTPTYCEICDNVTTTAQTHRFDFDCYDADGFCNNHGCLVEFEATADHIPDANFGICSEESFCITCSELVKEAGEHAPDYDCYDADGICNIDGCGYEFTEDDFVVHTPVDVDNDCTTSTLCGVCGQITTAAKEHTFDLECWDEDGICNNHGCLVDITDLLVGHTSEADDNNCDTDTVCGICGEVTEAAPGHTYEQGVCDAECDVCGYMRAIVHVEDEDDGNCATPILCVNCGVILVEAEEHIYSNDCGDRTCDKDYCNFDQRPIEELDPTLHEEFFVNDCTQDVLCMHCGTLMFEGRDAHIYTDDCDAACDNKGCAFVRDDAPHYELTPGDNLCTTAELCSKCGDTIVEAREAHTPDEVCYDADGICNFCDYEFVEGDLIDHVNVGIWDGDDMIKRGDDFDCTTAEICDVCNEVFIEAITHVYENECGDRSCNNEGCTYLRDIAPEDHTPFEDDGDCTTEVLCQLCGYVAIPAREAHTPDEVCYDADGICNFCEYEFVDGDLIDHVNEDNDFDCTTAEFCDVCGEELEAVLVHVYENECGDRSCNNAGCNYLRESAPEPHTPKDDDGDCTTEVLCQVCGYVAIAAEANHAPTFECFDEDMMCNNEGCECEIDESLLVGHTANEHTNLCTDRQYCTVCDFTLVEAKDDHNFDDLCDDLFCNNPYCVYAKELEDLEPHTWVEDGDCRTAEFCTECGHVAVAAQTRHTYDAVCYDEDGICNIEYCTHEAEAGELVECDYEEDGDCKTAEICSGCLRTMIEAAEDHVYDYACSDRTCNNVGCVHIRDIEEFAAHTYDEDGDCTTEEICEVCGNIAKPATNHIYSSTCDTTCDHHYCTQVRETEHTYPAQIPAINPETGKPDCTYADILCTVCGELLIEKNEAHQFLSVCDPTCNVAGCEYKRVAPHVDNIEYSTDCTVATKCPSCNEIIVNAKEHAFSDPCKDTDCNNDNCNYVRTELAIHTPEADDHFCLTATKCVFCGDVLVAAKSVHTYDNDCDITCNNEGCSYTKSTSELKDHVPATDDGNCLTAVKCKVCDAIVVDAKLGHVYDNSCDTKCNNDGCKKGDRDAVHAALPDDGYCMSPVYCAQCNGVVVPAADAHSYSNNCSDTTCNNPGCNYNRAVSELSGHTAQPDDGLCTTPVYCANVGCTAIVVEAKVHEFDNSCDTDCNNGCNFSREITHTPEVDDGDCGTALLCKICDYELVASMQHTFNKDDNCDATCNNSGCQYTRIPAHNPKADDGDCTTAIMCKDCGQVVVAVKAHTYDNSCDTDCNNTGCTKGGRTTNHIAAADDGDCATARCCAVCGVEVVAAAEHTYGTLNAYCTTCDYVALWLIILIAAVAFVLLLLILAIVFRIAGGSKKGRTNCKAMKYGGMYPRR